MVLLIWAEKADSLPHPQPFPSHCSQLFFMFWDELQERHPCVQMLGALFSNQLCGFRRPKRTSGLSTMNPLFRKLKRLVVVSEMTCLKFWSWHKLLFLLKRMVGRNAAIGAGGPETEAVVISTDNSTLASLQLLHTLSCGQRKNFIRQRVSILLKCWAERKGNWAADRGRIYNRENHVSVEFFLITGTTPRPWMRHRRLSAGWCSDCNIRTPERRRQSSLKQTWGLKPLCSGSPVLAWLFKGRGQWLQDSKAKMGTANPCERSIVTQNFSCCR